MIKLKYYIDEIGEHIKLHNMIPYETSLTQVWGKHKDRLYADYDFPSLSMAELVEWLELKTSKGRAIISISTINDRIIGYISLRNTNRFFKRGELGIVLNPDEINKLNRADCWRNALKVSSMVGFVLSISCKNE